MASNSTVQNRTVQNSTVQNAEPNTVDPLKPMASNKVSLQQVSELGDVENNQDQEQDEAQYHAFCSAYQQRELALNLVNQLNHFVKDVQRHRGISMGILGGNRAFETDFYRLQVQIDRRLATLEAFACRGEELFSLRDKENIHFAWRTIRHDWQGDKVGENFELHSHFIEQIFQVKNLIAKRLEQPIISEFTASQDNDENQQSHPPQSLKALPRLNQQIELINFICALLPNMIECMAKIRGLASFSAAVGSAEYDHDRKLRYLSQVAREQNDKIRHCAQRLHDVLGGEINAKYTIGEMETKFMHFIELVTHDVLSGKTITSSSSQIFTLATVLIDTYWSVVDEGMNALRRWHRDDLEAWIMS